MDASKYIPLSNKMKDITGQRFGCLVALGPVGQAKSSAVIWRFACDCGNHTEVPSGRAISGNTRSCGCMSSGGKKTDRTYHGMAGTKEYHAWHGMKRRCTNPADEAFHYYGGRGIAVCDRWLNSFDNFYADMGPAPSPKHSIDRDDNDGPYSPENCRWATQKEQMNNMRRNRHVEIDGERMTIAQASDRYGINYHKLFERIEKLGWSADDAVKTPDFSEGRIEYKGRAQSLEAWAKETGISRSTLSARINQQGWTVERALTAPPRGIRSPRHQKRSVFLDYNGERLTIAEWSGRTGIGHSTLLYRYKQDWSPEEILTTPVKKRSSR